MKKVFALLLALSMMFTLVACGGEEAPAGGGEAAAESYKVGICQLVQHPALDAATEGFIDVLTEELGDKVSFNNQNASRSAGHSFTPW